MDLKKNIGNRKKLAYIIPIFIVIVFMGIFTVAETIITDSGTSYFSSNIDMNNNTLTNVSNPVSDSDIATKGYVDANSGETPFIYETILNSTEYSSSISAGTGWHLLNSYKNITVDSPYSLFLIMHFEADLYADGTLSEYRIEFVGNTTGIAYNKELSVSSGTQGVEEWQFSTVKDSMMFLGEDTLYTFNIYGSIGGVDGSGYCKVRNLEVGFSYLDNPTEIVSGVSGGGGTGGPVGG